MSIDLFIVDSSNCRRLCPALHLHDASPTSPLAILEPVRLTAVPLAIQLVSRGFHIITMDWGSGCFDHVTHIVYKHLCYVVDCWDLFRPILVWSDPQGCILGHKPLTCLYCQVASTKHCDEPVQVVCSSFCLSALSGLFLCGWHRQQSAPAVTFPSWSLMLSSAGMTSGT
jgi:hypothetical protein